jgi:myosin heavy subunit
MLENKKKQNFIISGESGSGKTENTKFIIEYLVNNLNENILIKKLLDANPLLEAFGNAKTVKNNNSSRFGKFIKIFFSETGKILKAEFKSYLLEKSRVIDIQKGEGERNYHIFYQFILGANNEEKLKYEIKNIEYYDYLNNKKNNNKEKNKIDLNENMNDAQGFELTKKNLKTFNFSEQDIDNIFKIISGILYLGNIKFENLNDSVEISDESKEDFKWAANFLGLEEKKLREILISQKKLYKCYNYINGLAQQIYSQLFEYIITKINKEMDCGGENNYENNFQISILDIFGFENFENNSFEQLCINYCNERLQQYFIKHVFYLEQKKYNEELNLQIVEYKDNQKIIQLIDGTNSEKKKKKFQA